ncbi:MAG TPA: kelch repeat-containing protein [Tepidisphaeraceae bacterium]|nr:kelch repeat-containing protein [Tepidisphaeraceae bacterium]
MTTRFARESVRPGRSRYFRRNAGGTYGVETLERRTLLTALAWAAGPTLPVGRGHAAAVSQYGNIYLLGGSPASGSSSAVLELAYGASSWSSAPVLDTASVSPGAGVTGQSGPIINTSEGPAYKYTSDLFVFGGAVGGQPTATTVNYDPSPGGEGTTTAPSMSAARSAFAYATDPVTGNLYAFGGLGTSNKALAAGEMYNEDADVWTSVAPLPQPLYNATAASDGAGHLLVFGGDDASGNLLDTVYRYTIATNSWDQAGPMPMALAQSSAVFGAYGLVYLIGGLSASGAVANVENYDPVTDTWTDEMPLPSPVYGAGAVIDFNQNIQVIGGYGTSSTTPLTTVWASPVGPAPVGIPLAPQLGFSYLGTVYDGAPQPVTPTAVGSDGVTPVNGTFTVTYDGSATPPTNAGQYHVIAYFTSADPGYVSSVENGTLQIIPATPAITLTGGGTVLWTGQPHPVTATEVGIDGVTPVPGSFNITYNGSTTAPTNAGAYNVLATFTSADPNYANATATTTITIPDPTIPTGVKVVGYTTHSIEIAWNPVPVPISSYTIYQKFGYLHGGYHYSAIATGLTGTSDILSLSSGTFAVASVSPTGVVSARSADASGSALSPPSLYGVITSGGALVSSITCEVGQPVTATLDAYGNLYPTFTMTSGPATMSVSPTTGVISYTPAQADVGTQYATFVATNSVGSATLTVPFVVQDVPTVQVTGGTYDFDGNTHAAASAVAYGVDGVTPVSGTFTFAYAPVQYPNVRSPAPYSAPGTYIVYATFNSGDPTYSGAVGTGTLVIRPAVPGTAGNDPITLVQDADGEHIDWSLPGMSGQVLINDPLGLTIDGNGGSDAITLDYTLGNPLPNFIRLNGTFILNGLQGTSPLAGTTLDLGRSTLYVSYADTSSDPLAAIQQYLLAGYNNGAWTGAATATTATTGAITSAAAAADSTHATAIGYADFADGSNVDTLANTIELKFTLAGDANLDGTVNSADLQTILAGLNRPGAWDQGDFNYDGAVNSADLQELLTTLNTSLTAQTATAVSALKQAPINSTPSATPTVSTAATPIVTVPVSPKIHHTTFAHPRKRR